MSATGTILLVDDEKEFVGVVGEMLRGEGYTLIEAESGQLALEAYAKCPPDLVLLDVNMVGLDGFDICRRLKAQYGDYCAPVIFLTARNKTTDVTTGFSVGGTDYLTKPCRINEVRARIRPHIQSHLLLKQQQHLVEQMSRANISKNRFMGMAAHDMRNPLVTIRGMAEFLLDGTVGTMTTPQLGVVMIIRSTSQLMIDKLNRLLDVATIESGEFKLNLVSVDLSDLVAKTVAICKREAAKKRIHIDLVSPEASPSVILDAEKIKQVVDNLLGNAIEYSPVGSTVTITVLPTTEAACGFTVCDQGPGIPEAERQNLFRTFGPLPTQPVTSEKTTGIGLLICRRIVEAHSGVISVENLPKGGCEFRVTLPLVDLDASLASS